MNLSARPSRIAPPKVVLLCATLPDDAVLRFRDEKTALAQNAVAAPPNFLGAGLRGTDSAPVKSGLPLESNARFMMLTLFSHS